MKSDTGLNGHVIIETYSASPTKRRSIWSGLLTPFVCTVLATFGIFGGISSLFVGLICVLIHGLVSHDRIFDQVGTVLLIVAIPMILIGSIFLDEIPGTK